MRKRAIRLLERCLPQRVVYWIWIATQERRLMRKAAGRKPEAADSPTVSVLIPVYDPPAWCFALACLSVIAQDYPRWELCIVDDRSSRSSARLIARFLAKTDSRIKIRFREVNGNISAATNDALEMATGEFCALLDHDDLLSKRALGEVARAARRPGPPVDMIYTDEDKVGRWGLRYSPYFKPGWSPDTLLSRMYTGHLSAYRTSLLRKIGGFRIGYEGSQDHDLALRVSERARGIVHIPMILYHWRAIAGSTASSMEVKPYAEDSGLRAVQDALDRRTEGGSARCHDSFHGYYLVDYSCPKGTKAEVIIPTKDNYVELDACLRSLFGLTRFDQLSVTVVSNAPELSESVETLRSWQSREPSRLRVLLHDGPFNFASICNRAALASRADFLVFMNDDVEALSADWLARMMGFAARETIGAVGAMLVYPDGRVQHAGIVMGVAGVANHHHKGTDADDPGNNIGQLVAQANYSAVTGACMAVRRESFLAAGGFDESLAVAFNDVDLCLRLAKDGKRNIVLPDVRLIHHESSSRDGREDPRRSERFRAEIGIMKGRWAEVIVDDPYYNPNLTRDTLDYGLRFD